MKNGRFRTYLYPSLAWIGLLSSVATFQLRASDAGRLTIAPVSAPRLASPSSFAEKRGESRSAIQVVSRGTLEHEGERASDAELL